MPIKIHMHRTYERMGGQVNTTLCGRMRCTSDGMNLTTDEDAVTCAFCLRRLAVIKMAAMKRAANA